MASPQNTFISLIISTIYVSLVSNCKVLVYLSGVFTSGLNMCCKLRVFERILSISMQLQISDFCAHMIDFVTYIFLTILIIGHPSYNGNY